MQLEAEDLERSLDRYRQLFTRLLIEVTRIAHVQPTWNAEGLIEGFEITPHERADGETRYETASNVYQLDAYRAENQEE